MNGNRGTDDTAARSGKHRKGKIEGRAEGIIETGVEFKLSEKEIMKGDV